MYSSPGYQDPWTVKYHMYKALRRESAKAAMVYLLGNGSQRAVEGFCRERGYTLTYAPALPAKEVVKQFAPDRVLVFSKDGDYLLDYVKLLIERGVGVIYTLSSTNN